MSGYVRHIQEDPREAQILFKELLIGVTNFFRDQEAFESLKEKVIPQLLENRTRRQPGSDLGSRLRHRGRSLFHCHIVPGLHG